MANELKADNVVMIDVADNGEEFEYDADLKCRNRLIDHGPIGICRRGYNNPERVGDD